MKHGSQCASPAATSAAGKPRAAIHKPSRRTRGFETCDQRLPESPPTHDQNAGTGRILMDAIRTRYRNALQSLFGGPLRVLNAECNAALFNTVPGATPSCSGVAPKKSATTVAAVALGASASRKVNSATEQQDQVVPGSEQCAAALRKQVCSCGTQLWREGGVRPEHMLRTAEELMSRIMLLYARCVDATARTVDYSSLLHSDDFKLYLASARKLRYFDPTLLSGAQRKAFFLNVYNSLMIHAIAVLSRPTSPYERIQLFNTAAYSIGGRVYSLNMIEHGVLRCNRAGGGGPFTVPPFVAGDARLQCTLHTLDPRIHFALNCGARSCPPVRYYDAHRLEESLDAATRAFLAVDVTVDAHRKTVVLSRIFQWYRHDFSDAGDLFAVLKWMLPYLDAMKRHALQQLINEHDVNVRVPKIEFADYDWTLNDSSL